MLRLSWPVLTLSSQARKDAPFDGYFLRDSIGNIDYMGPQFHTLAHTDARHMVQRAAAATAGRH